MSQDKSPENFDDIDELATSLQDKIKQLNGANLSSDANEYVVDHSIGNDKFETDIDNVSIREQLTEGFKEQEESEKTSKVKTSMLIAVLSVALIAIAVLSATLFFPSAEEEVARLKELPLSLPTPVVKNTSQNQLETNFDHKVIASENLTRPDSNTKPIIQEQDLLTDKSSENRVKKIPFVLVDEPELVAIDKTNQVAEENNKEKVQTVESGAVTVSDSIQDKIIDTTNTETQVQVVVDDNVTNDNVTKDNVTNENKIINNTVPEIVGSKDISRTTQLKQIEAKPLGIDFKHESTEQGQEKISENFANEKTDKVSKTKLDDLKVKSNDLLLTTSINETQVAKEVLLMISPDVVITENKRQHLSLTGNNFTENTEIVVKWIESNADKSKKVEKSKKFSKTLTPTQFEIVNDKQIRLYLNTGRTAGQWLFSLASADDTKSIILNVHLPYQNSNDSHFQKEVMDDKSSSENKANLPATKPQRDDLKPETSILTKLNNYTIQLLSASNLSAIKKIQSKYPKVKPLTWVKTNTKGKTWYRLIYGSFKTKNQANAAYKKLPIELQTKGYWIRKVKGLLHSPTTGTKTNKGVKSNDFEQVSGSQLLKLLSVPAHNWTLELLTFNSKNQMFDYISANKLGKQANYYKKVINGKVRYTLIYGVFSSKRETTKALQNLPKSVRISKPWLKKYSDIQWDIKNSLYYQ